MKPQTKRQYLKQLVSEKSAWCRSLTEEERKLGFLGWHERGYLPHCDFPGLVQLVTFPLHDSMPASRRGEWGHLLKIEDARERRDKLEQYLDRGVGNCVLGDPQAAKITEDALLYFHEERYELLPWCIMPNHVHVLHHVWQTPLSKNVQSWKICSASRASRLRGRAEPFWQREYWDTFMRDAEQERKAIAYIENNPVKVRFCRSCEDWPYSSARFRDSFQRLELPKKVAYAG